MNILMLRERERAPGLVLFRQTAPDKQGKK